MRLTVVPALLIILASFAAIAGPAQAGYETLDYTVLATDDTDDAQAGGFLEITEFAVADGAGRIVFRVTTESTEVVDQSRSTVEIRYTAVGQERFIIFRNDGAYANDPLDAEDGGCQVADNVYYCAVLLGQSSLQLKRGTELTELYVVSKLLTPETATAGISDETDHTDKYTILADGQGGSGDATETLEDLGSGAVSFEITGDGSDATHVYNWTNTFNAVDIAYDANVSEGSLDIVVAMNSTELINQSFDASASGSLPIEDADQGDHVITVTLTGFNGTFSVDITKLAKDASGNAGEAGDDVDDAGDDVESHADDAMGHDNQTADGANNTTGLDEKDTPAPGMIAVMAVLGLVIVAFRRRD